MGTQTYLLGHLIPENVMKMKKKQIRSWERERGVRVPDSPLDPVMPGDYR